ncbi:hypothetical protein [Streptomyces sp. NPDC002769]|uniref:hypothetical protein n=1 Tax=Streptomyces sp. NPDC002769 TaxID=3154542 RepID=UPI00333018C8
MSEHLTLIEPHSGDTGTGPAWSLIPPRAVRQLLYKRLKNVRRPAGTLALPAITTTSTLYFTHVMPHSDAPVALGLTGLVVLYDSVVTVCRTWHKTRATTSTEQKLTPTSARAI